MTKSNLKVTKKYSKVTIYFFEIQKVMAQSDKVTFFREFFSSPTKKEKKIVCLFSRTSTLPEEKHFGLGH